MRNKSFYIKKVNIFPLRTPKFNMNDMKSIANISMFVIDEHKHWRQILKYWKENFYVSITFSLL